MSHFLIPTAVLLLAAGPVYFGLVRYKNHQLEGLLREVAGWLSRHGIEHWLDWGTLLGAMRDGGVIDHDNDVDLSTPVANAERLRKALVDDRLAERFRVIDRGTSVQFGHFRHPYLHTIADELFVEIKFVEEDAARTGMIHESRLHFPSSLVRPLTTVQFEKRPYPAPGQAAEYLRTLYGETGRKVIYVGNDRYRRCETLLDHVGYWCQQLVFYRLYFAWKFLPLPRTWKHGFDRITRRLSKALSFPEPKT